jgi:hypothetical protein
MALIADRYRQGSDTAITFIVTLMGVASVLGNYFIGAITEGIKQLFSSSAEQGTGLLRGLQAGYSFIGLCALLCSVFAYLLYRHLQKKGELL